MAGSGFSLSGDSHAVVQAGDQGNNAGIQFGAVYDGGAATLAVAGDSTAKVVSALPWYGWATIAVVAVVGLWAFLRGK